MARLLSPRSLQLTRFRFFLLEVFLERLAASLHAFHGHHDRFGLSPSRTADPLRPNPAPSMLSAHLALPRTSSGRATPAPSRPLCLGRIPSDTCLRVRRKAAPRDSAHHRTAAGPSPDPTSDAARSASPTLILHPRATLDGSTRLRAERALQRPGGNLLAPAVPQVACF